MRALHLAVNIAERLTFAPGPALLPPRVWLLPLIPLLDISASPVFLEVTSAI